MTAVSVEAVTRRFGAVRALHDITFRVARGEVVGLLGHNGAGKTTTIRILNGLLRQDHGEVRVLDLDPAVAGAEIRALTGVLTETPSLDERLTARENLAFFAGLFGVDSTRRAGRVSELLEQFELGERAEDRVSGFSRGMKQRLALARALLHDPELLFLDEPTAALDPVAARGVHQLIRGFAADPRRTVVISTHNLVEAQRLCDRVLILRQGRLIAAGTPLELARRMVGQARVELQVDPRDVDVASAAVAETEPAATIRTDSDVLTLSGVATDRLPALVARLVQAEVRIYRLTPADPSLEDAYFALHASDSHERP